jgi:class 3 adenylate cyclase
VAIRLGFSVDIVGYSRRLAPAKEDLQQRLAALLDSVLDDSCTDITETDRQDTGDGMHVFLPQTIQLHEALPALLHSWRDRLEQDNRRFTDRMRLRLAVAVGPVGLAALGFGGSTVIEVSRLLDSPSVRQLVIDEPQRDLAAIVSDPLYSYVVGEGYPGLAADEFRLTEARVKTFSAKAWLWRP